MVFIMFLDNEVCGKQIVEAAPYKTTAVGSFTTLLINYTDKMN